MRTFRYRSSWGTKTSVATAPLQLWAYVSIGRNTRSRSSQTPSLPRPNTVWSFTTPVLFFSFLRKKMESVRSPPLSHIMFTTDWDLDSERHAVFGRLNVILSETTERKRKEGIDLLSHTLAQTQIWIWPAMTSKGLYVSLCHSCAFLLSLGNGHVTGRVSSDKHTALRPRSEQHAQFGNKTWWGGLKIWMIQLKRIQWLFISNEKHQPRTKPYKL